MRRALSALLLGLSSLVASHAVAQVEAEAPVADAPPAERTESVGEPEEEEADTSAEEAEAPAEEADESAEQEEADTPAEEAEAPAEDTAEEADATPAQDPARPEDATIYVDAAEEGDASTALGTVTVVSAIVALGTMAYFIERNSSAETCQSFEAAVPSTRGCLNLPLVLEQRDIGLGLLLGASAVVVAFGLSWAIVAASEGQPEAAELSCAPGIGALSCSGRF